ncbi:MAG: DUF2207 domain-containing protein [Phycisphaerae bacterium]|nr:DUF2207 domain-containing protein [Phycisphaerae bacterium]
MRRKWVSLAMAVLMCWIFGAYQVRSQTRPAVASMPSTKPAKPIPPAGPERVLHFHAEIAVHDDFSLTVTESIRIVVLGRVIRRGIIRDLPPQYRKKDGTKVAVPFEVVALLKNGRPEPYHIVGGGRVYMGQKDVFLKPGVYTYTLVYRTKRQPRNHNNRDELHWTVAGDDWSFDMEHVSARVKLPEGIPSDEVRHVAHTGVKGAAGQDYRARIDGGERVCFTTTRKLGRDEDLTISVTWPEMIDSPYEE